MAWNILRSTWPATQFFKGANAKAQFIISMTSSLASVKLIVCLTNRGGQGGSLWIEFTLLEKHSKRKGNSIFPFFHHKLWCQQLLTPLPSPAHFHPPHFLLVMMTAEMLGTMLGCYCNARCNLNSFFFLWHLLTGKEWGGGEITTKWV